MTALSRESRASGSESNTQATKQWTANPSSQLGSFFKEQAEHRRQARNVCLGIMLHVGRSSCIALTRRIQNHWELVTATT